MDKLIENPLFTKILITVIAVVIKVVLDAKLKDQKKVKGLQKLISIIIYYVLPIFIIVWLNIDDETKNNKLTTTLIAFNIGIMVFNFFQRKVYSQHKSIAEFIKTETERSLEVNKIRNLQEKRLKEMEQLNAVREEKMNAIHDNQKYISNELSNINDRIIKYFADK